MATTDIIADGHEDSRQDRWVTYDQLAELRRTSRASAVRQARRRKWRRQQDNQGNVLVLVPEDELRPSPDSPPDEPADGHQDGPSVISALQSAFQTTLAAKDEVIAAQSSVITSCGQVSTRRGLNFRTQGQLSREPS
jgi:hypothetical protein